MSKFKIGDEVVCVDSKLSEYEGSGWEPNKKFIIDHIKPVTNSNCYFPKTGAGVYEYALELADKSLIKKHSRKKFKISIK